MECVRPEGTVTDHNYSKRVKAHHDDPVVALEKCYDASMEGGRLEWPLKVRVPK